MPLGFERINERTKRPNALINFIRTIPGPTSAVAQDILNRVAAICYPFMKSNMILVQALEEFPFNIEFVGRNFNAGEVIQLVLRDRNGKWLPQKLVEMVMVHELAHCKQMNHSKAFWKVRDEYAVDLRVLWGKGYTGEGMWGRGRDLDTGALQLKDGEAIDIPEQLCGGTYGRRGMKRKNNAKDKPILSYAERKQRRILKKFGAGGHALGADDDAKVKLEGGMPKKGKPRVAGSARGRNLRAEAALARFDTAKNEEVTVKREHGTSDSETEDEFVEGDQLGAAVDVDGKMMFDEKGRALVKICEDENDKNENARKELEEMQDLATPMALAKKAASKSAHQPNLAKDSRARRETSKPGRATSTNAEKSDTLTTKKPSASVIHLDEQWKRRPDPVQKQLVAPDPIFCPLCSMKNTPASLTCMACSNVLNFHLMTDHWECRSATCKGSQYINAGDSGLCGICGAPKG